MLTIVVCNANLPFGTLCGSTWHSKSGQDNDMRKLEVARCFLCFFLVILVIGSLGYDSLTYGWGGPSHSKLAGFLMNDPVIAPFVPASCNVGTVTGFIGEPTKSWHHPGWGMIRNRGYLTNYNGSQN